MILSLGLILITGFLVGFLLNKIRIPGLVGMILVGLVFGPYALNIIDSSILNISSELRQIALVIILTRSGLNLDIASLKKIGRPAILMCFIPATLEIASVAVASYLMLNLTFTEGLLLGSVLAAVSPAVVSPRMIKLIENKYGEEHNVPKLILAGSSVDDIYVIILFYGFLGAVETSNFNFVSTLMIPVSIILGIALGVIVGIILSLALKKFNFNLGINIIITLSCSFLMIGLENFLKPWVSVSALLGIIVMAIIILFKNTEKAKELSKGYNYMWQVFEILLFVLVGASLNITAISSNDLLGLAVILIGLLFRSLGVYLCLLKTNLTFKERLFSILAYLPKATVQASIGGIALSKGLPCGNIILSIAIFSILITAPIGALLIDNLAKLLLNQTKEEENNSELVEIKS